jgi:hypothetical protein
MPSLSKSTRLINKSDADPQTLRISMDAKVAVKVGEFDRGGKTRVTTIALDHDFEALTTLTPRAFSSPNTMNCICSLSALN